MKKSLEWKRGGTGPGYAPQAWTPSLKREYHELYPRLANRHEKQLGHELAIQAIRDKYGLGNEEGGGAGLNDVG